MDVEVDVLGSPSLVNNPYGLCGSKAALYSNVAPVRAQELCERRGGRPGPPCP